MKDELRVWVELVETATNQQLIGLWENGTYMSNQEYEIWLHEVRRRNLIKEVLG